MYKIFVMVATGSFSAGRAIHTQTIEFVTQSGADRAYDLLIRQMASAVDCETTVVKLY